MLDSFATDSSLRNKFILFICGWSLIVVASLAWNISHEKEQTMNMAQNEARTHFSKDQAFRFWATAHGGVYVPSNERTPPNAHLAHLAERDIETLSGKQLTLMNPAYMIRQLMDEYTELYGIKGRIVSLKPFRKENTPDPWERRALLAFEKGEKEVFEINAIEGQPYLRLMKPMMTNEGCLKCHAVQGYKVGDVRGGVGVSVPMGPYLSNERSMLNTLSISHAVIWLLGIFGIILVQRRMQQDSLEGINAHNALQKSEAKFRHLVESLERGYFIYSHDTEGMFTYLSPSVTQVLGYSQDEFMKHYTEYLTDSPINRVVESYTEAALRGEKQPSYELEISDKRGKVRVLNITEGPVFSKDGRVTGVEGIAHDITEQRQAENSMRRTQFAVDHAGDAIFWIAPDARFVSVNKLACQSLGYLREELLCMTVSDIAPEFPKDKWPGLWQNIKQQGNLRFENYHRHKDGGIFQVELVVTYFEFGGDEYILAFARDITERKQVEKEIDEIHHYLQSVFDSMPSTLVGIDSETRIQHWNHEAERVTGIKEADALGSKVDQVLPMLSEQMSQVQAALTDKQPHKVEKLVHKEGSENHYADVVIYPLIVNSVVGAVIRVDDITERVRIEQLMTQTEKMMSVGGLAAGMAHELNNPLGGMMQGIQNIQRRLSSELSKNRKVADELELDLEKVQEYMRRREIERFMDGVVEAGHRASGIVNNMLRFSRKADNNACLEDLSGLIDQTIELASVDYNLKKKFDFRSIELSRAYEAEMSPVPCVASEIQQVLLNLLRNAAQAFLSIDLDSEPRRIAVRTYQQDDSAYIEVEDNGPGIDEETKKRIFEPFFTTRDPGEGTGLGLSVSYYIICDEHGGSLEIESEVGKGSKFIIKLPIAVSE